MNQEEHSRRHHKRPLEPKGAKTLTVLLLLLNTSALACLLILNFQSYNQSENQESRLDTVEYKIDALAQGLASRQTQTNTKETTKTNKNSSTQNTSQTQTVSSSSDERNISQDVQETPSSSSQEVSSSSTQESTTYTVKSGDTLSMIAELHNLTVAELMSKNDLTDSSLFIGQELSLK